MMEQQAICQPQEQVNSPQVPQQMVQQHMMLCPVRLVYETPVLMQPGSDQLQPNQTVFMNPQNPPPWARPVHNQVIYVQQVQPNMMPMQQHIDPNQMYLQQQILNYQQMMPNTVISQSIQEPIRQVPMQVTNVIPTNVMQHLQTVNPNVQHIDERGQLVQSYELNQLNSGVSGANAINKVNVVQNINNRPMIGAVQSLPQVVNQSIGTQTQKGGEMQKQVVYRNVAPQIPQQPMIRPHMQQVLMNPIQNMSNVQTIQHVPQTFAQNIRQTIQQPHNIIQNTPQNLQQTYVNNIANMQPNVERIVASTEISRPANPTTVSYNAVRNGQAYTYRAIQPRPMQYKNMPSLLPMPGVQNTLPPRPNTSINVGNQTPSNQLVKPPSTTSSISLNYVRNSNNSPIASRKRKSESPDEIQKKISTRTTVYGDMTVTTKIQSNPAKPHTSSSEIGVNTNPLHRNIDKTTPSFQIKPMEITINKTKEETVASAITPNEVKSQLNIIQTAVKQEVKDNKQTDKERLLRNTVYTQARGRLLADKQTLQPNINSMVEIKKEENPIFKPKDISNNSTIQIEQKSPDVHLRKQHVEVPNIEALKPVAFKLPDTKLPKQLNLKTKESTTQSEEKLKPNQPIPGSHIESVVEISKAKTKTPLSTLELEVNKTETTIKSEENKLKPNESSTECEESIMPIKIEVTIRSSKGACVSKTDTFIKPDDSNIKYNDTFRTIIKLDTKTTETVKSEQTTIANTDVDMEMKPTNTKTEIKLKLNETPKAEANITEIVDNEKVKTECENNFAETKNRKEYTNLSVNDINGKEIHIVDGNIVKEDKDYILTHVLDGYVIQESNTPFAIRKPLKEKTLHPNTPLFHDYQNQDSKGADNLINMKDSISKDNKKILDLTYLHLNGERSKEILEDNADKEIDNDDPFGDVKQAAVKTWTVEELSSHLSKYLWTDTVSLLREHEIDGESLFLASKLQLLTIGISEAHVDIICNFVKS